MIGVAQVLRLGAALLVATFALGAALAVEGAIMGQEAAPEAETQRPFFATPDLISSVQPEDSFYTRIRSRKLFEPTSKRPPKPPEEAKVERPKEEDTPPPPPAPPSSTLLMTGIVQEGDSLVALLEDREKRKAYAVLNQQVIGPDTVVAVSFDGLELRQASGPKTLVPGESWKVLDADLPAAIGDMAAPKAKNAVVGKYDKDGDGKVTFEEYGGSRGMFKRLDKNGDGVVSDDDV